MRVLFISATNIQIYSNESTSELVDKGNKEVDSLLPNSIFHDNYTSAFNHFKSNPYSFTHIVTGCTPEKGLYGVDKIYDKKTIDYMTINFPRDMESWLYTYRCSFHHLAKFREINKDVKIILYSGYGTEKKPVGSFNDCLQYFIGDYDYVPKTNDNRKDAFKIIDFLKAIKGEISIRLDIENPNKIKIDILNPQGLFSDSKKLEEIIQLYINTTTGILPLELQEFEHLLNSNCSEFDIDNFLRKNPNIFVERSFQNDILIQPKLIQDGSVLKPDFILKPIIGTFSSQIVELKKANANTVTNRENREDFSASVHQAVRQVIKYQEYFDDKANRLQFQTAYNTLVFKPTARVIIGKNWGQLTDEQIISIKDAQRRMNIEVLNYEELFKIAKQNAKFYYK